MLIVSSTARGVRAYSHASVHNAVHLLLLLHILSPGGRGTGRLGEAGPRCAGVGNGIEKFRAIGDRSDCPGLLSRNIVRAAQSGFLRSEVVLDGPGCLPLSMCSALRHQRSRLMPHSLRWAASLEPWTPPSPHPRRWRCEIRGNWRVNAMLHSWTITKGRTVSGACVRLPRGT